MYHITEGQRGNGERIIEYKEKKILKSLYKIEKSFENFPKLKCTLWVFGSIVIKIMFITNFKRNLSCEKQFTMPQPASLVGFAFTL